MAMKESAHLKKGIRTDGNALVHAPKLPWGAVAFDRISEQDIREAVTLGIRREDEEIAGITANPAKPTFQNTLLPLENAGRLLEDALTVMGIMLNNATSDALETMAQELTPMVSEHNDNIRFNKALFERIAAVKRSGERLTDEEQRLLDVTYEEFVRRGIHLPPDRQRRLREITQKTAKLTLQFSKNVLDDTNSFLLTVTDKEKLRGLTALQRASAAQTAKERGKKGWAFTLQAPSMRPLLMYCKDRGMRKKIWLAYNRLGMKNGRWDNRPLVKELVNLRRERAQILGFDCYADLVLTRRMAGNKERVAQFLEELIKAYRPQAVSEYKELKAYILKKETAAFKPKPWDDAYYSRMLKKEKYDFDAETLRPYFELGNVITGVFGLAKTLYGITFKENKALPAWDRDVKVYEVYDADNSFLALLYADFHPRRNKKSGAWTFGIKGQRHTEDGRNIRPHVGITMNFSKPAGKKPALLTLEEVTTFLHEFGHALHEMFSNTRFESQSGTNVYWDFVELPSQFMENYALEADFLKTFAFHYKTGKTIPSDMTDKIIRSKNYHAATACLRQVGFGMLDMAYYTLTEPFDEDVIKFEKKAWKKSILRPQNLKVCMTTQFQHIMTGGYAAGYYSYKWAELLDADAFAYFKENGIFNRKTAQKFRDNILSKGATQDPNILYKNFRGKEPSIEAMLLRDGIINDTPKNEQA